MVAITACGEIVSDIQITKTDDRIDRVNFVLESNDLSSLPMHWTILASGNQAQRAVDLVKKGTKLCLCGRVFAGGEPRRVVVNLSAFETIGTTSIKG